jgi:hypothetical protein
MTDVRESRARWGLLGAVVVLTLAAGCATLWPQRTERERTMLAIAYECADRVHGTQVRGLDSYGRVTYMYTWEPERMAFEECYFEGARTRRVAGPVERPIATLLGRR